MKTLKNFLTEAKAKSYPGYELYHSSYTSAVDAALGVARAKGYDVDPEEIFHTISTGPKKPSPGETISLTVALTKNGQPVKNHMLVYQVYNRDVRGISAGIDRTAHPGLYKIRREYPGLEIKKNFELNAYIS